MKPIQVISAALLFLVLGAAVPAPAQLGWANNAMNAKKALDTAQKAKQVADAAQKAKQIADAAQKAKQAADMVNKARQVQDMGNRARQVQDMGNRTRQVQNLGRQIEQPRPPLNSNFVHANPVRGNPVRGVSRPIRPEPRPLQDVMRPSKDWPNEHRNWVQRGGYRGYHIPNDWFNSRFGPGHPFRLNFTVAGNNPCFDFAGYSFQLVDPVPPGYADNWNQTDDVTINEDNSAGGYYLQNAKYPDGQFPSFLMSLTASDLPCSRLSMGFAVANDGSIREDPQQDYLVQQQDQPQQDQQQEDQPQQEAAAPPPPAPPDLSQTIWSGQIVFESGGFLGAKATKTIGRGGYVIFVFPAGGGFLLKYPGPDELASIEASAKSLSVDSFMQQYHIFQKTSLRGRVGNTGTWTLTGTTIAMRVPAQGCVGAGATFTGTLSPDGSTIDGTWSEQSGSMLFGCGAGSGTWQLHRLNTGGAAPPPPTQVATEAAPQVEAQPLEH
jgi:hypothetical protein